MLKYTIKRLLLAAVTVLIIAAITFFAMNAIPGGPFSKEKATDPTVQAMLEARFNLDKPVPEQFLIYMKNLLHGDFGISLKTGREISVTIRDSFAVSAKLGGMAAGLAVVLGLTLGSVAALTRNRWPDRVIIFLTTLFVSVPSFVLATLLLLVFCLILKWFSVFNPANPNYLLPVISLMLYPMAYITRLTKSSMLDVLGQDYIRTARAKGVPEKQVINRHAFRNTLIPLVTTLGGSLPSLFSGALITETLFGIRGIGYASYTSMTQADIPFVMFYLAFISILTLLGNLISDLLYAAVDPRVRLS